MLRCAFHLSLHCLHLIYLSVPARTNSKARGVLCTRSVSVRDFTQKPASVRRVEIQEEQVCLCVCMSLSSVCFVSGLVCSVGVCPFPQQLHSSSFVPSILLFLLWVAGIPCKTAYYTWYSISILLYLVYTHSRSIVGTAVVVAVMPSCCTSYSLTLVCLRYYVNYTHSLCLLMGCLHALLYSATTAAAAAESRFLRPVMGDEGVDGYSSSSTKTRKQKKMFFFFGKKKVRCFLKIFRIFCSSSAVQTSSRQYSSSTDDRLLFVVCVDHLYNLQIGGRAVPNTTPLLCSTSYTSNIHPYAFVSQP